MAASNSVKAIFMDVEEAQLNEKINKYIQEQEAEGLILSDWQIAQPAPVGTGTRQYGVAAWLVLRFQRRRSRRMP